ncbi:MAG: helix-turn-helix transcriptional regulator [Clostridia bacterium]|nr:helix-turn-helix transcriptional regulator [Clostridia bacterium]
MDTRTIGQKIATLRKKKGVTQEELANALTISAQAISKWENGGTPDIEHIPAIAQFFNVTTDELFGCSKISTSGLAQAIFTTIHSEKPENRMEKVFEICSMAEAGLFGTIGPIVFDERDSDKDFYSQMMTENGFTSMSLGSHMRFFLCVPELNHKSEVLLDNIDYHGLFNELSQKDVLDSIEFILKRKDIRKQFTNHLLHRELNLTLERAKEILSILQEYSLLNSSTLEIDDADEVVYTVNTCGASNIISILVFARNIIKGANSFYYYSGGRATAFL